MGCWCDFWDHWDFSAGSCSILFVPEKRRIIVLLCFFFCVFFLRTKLSMFDHVRKTTSKITNHTRHHLIQQPILTLKKQFFLIIFETNLDRCCGAVSLQRRCRAPFAVAVARHHLVGLWFQWLVDKIDL